MSLPGRPTGLELAERPVWSRSQVNALQECGRKFLLQQKAPRNAAIDPVYARAAKLKKLKNRYLWAGTFLHDSIASILKTVRQGQPVPEKDAFIEKAKLAMRDQFKASRDEIDDASRLPAGRLFEHEHKISLPPEVWRGAWTTVENSLRWFFQSKWLERLAALGPECWKAVDELLEFDVNGIKAYVKIDCAIESDGRFILIDWKSSGVDASHEFSLQVSALYAHEVWGAEIENTEALAVSLLDGKTFHAAVTEEALMETHLRIEEESARLQGALEELGRDPFAVPVCDNRETCRRCNFQTLCFAPGGNGAI